MAIERGESTAVGVAVETTRGTFVAATDYIRTREPASIQTIVEKWTLKSPVKQEHLRKVKSSP